MRHTIERFVAAPTAAIAVALGAVGCGEVSIGQEKEVKITFYGAYDNDPPGSTEIAFPRGDRTQAGGVGSYEDPLTFASPEGPGSYKVGQIIYVPGVDKYFTRDDMCAISHSALEGCGSTSMVDLYVGNPSDSPDVEACEWQLTPPNETGTIIIDPSPNLPYNPQPLWNQATGECATFQE